METRKISIACFTGGALFYGVTTAFAPQYWWVGILVGLVSGYACYDLRQFLMSIPKALNIGFKGLVGAVSIRWNRLVKFLTEWFSEEHPFMYPAFILAIPLGCLMVYGLYADTVTTSVAHFGPTKQFVNSVFLNGVSIMFSCVGYYVAALVIAWGLRVLAKVGSRKHFKCYWDDMWLDRYEQEYLDEQGLAQEPLTYRNALKWAFGGVIHLAWCLEQSCIVSTREFLKLVHSDKRLLCAFDGTLGGLIVYAYSPFTETMTEKLMMSVVGGSLGLILGLITWKVLSMRVSRQVVNCS